MNVPECVTVSKTHHTGFWEHRVPFSFFPPFHSPSLFNSTLLLPCHSLIFLSLLWFKSSAALFHFLVLSPFLRSCMLWWAWGCWASVVSSRGMAPEQRSRFEDEWMWHSAIILSLFSLVSLLLSHLPLLLFTPLFPISLSMYYLSLTLFACRLWEWCVWGWRRNRYSFPTELSLVVLLVRVCACKLYWIVNG